MKLICIMYICVEKQLPYDGYTRFCAKKQKQALRKILIFKQKYNSLLLRYVYYGVLVKFVAACYVFLMKNSQMPNKGIFYLKLQKETNFCG